ncbi:hypothetical protein TNCV_2797851 [Trichonephila clavipes]|nr:hypothetical protein TNCV_2797851 [Trichonephila clavipes]
MTSALEWASSDIPTSCGACGTDCIISRSPAGVRSRLLSGRKDSLPQQVENETRPPTEDEAQALLAPALRSLCLRESLGTK